MNVYAAPTSEVLNLSALDELHEFTSAGEKSLAIQLIDMFKAFGPPRLERMRQAFQNHDWLAIQAEAHSFRSTSANLGALRLSAKCGLLERLPVTEPPNVWADAIDDLAGEFLDARDALDQAIVKFRAL